MNFTMADGDSRKAAMNQNMTTDLACLSWRHRGVPSRHPLMWRGSLPWLSLPAMRPRSSLMTSSAFAARPAGESDKRAAALRSGTPRMRRQHLRHANALGRRTRGWLAVLRTWSKPQLHPLFADAFATFAPVCRGRNDIWWTLRS